MPLKVQHPLSSIGLELYQLYTRAKKLSTNLSALNKRNVILSLEFSLLD